jgi:hypothetical protein
MPKISAFVCVKVFRHTEPADELVNKEVSDGCGFHILHRVGFFPF